MPRPYESVWTQKAADLRGEIRGTIFDGRSTRKARHYLVALAVRNTRSHDPEGDSHPQSQQQDSHQTTDKPHRNLVH